MAAPRVIAPGAAIGILGGGQLGRMTALAAARLGYRCHVFGPEAGAPASQVAARTTVAAFDDAAALERFAAAVDVVTFEFENVPHEAAEALGRQVSVRPGANALAIAQDRLEEKRFFASIGAAAAAYRPVRGPGEVEAALAALAAPCVLKTTRLGYDGKGQVRIDHARDAAAAWARLAAPVGIVERLVDFACEISVVIARGADGATAAYCPVENRHRNHILDVTVAPADVPAPVARAAGEIALRAAEALELVGLLAVEMFVTAAGEVLVNEIAPRPHNSGHWTIDACATSQFEQLVRAICGLPLGSPERHSDAVMTNLLGADAGRWAEILAEPGARLHLYGKAEARPGRKMGHVTRLKPRGDGGPATPRAAAASRGRRRGRGGRAGA
ncbi:MAG TPA: 5-(carboxyamino)imidazole ribonucleotide synthase [Alphaproteobacteria bacterium]